MNFLNFIHLLWLHKRMPLFLGYARKVFRGRGAPCLQVLQGKKILLYTEMEL